MKFNKTKALEKVQLEINELKALEAKIEAQTEDHCKRVEHLCVDFVTGGRSGHCVTYCRCCDYRVEGWDD